MSNLTNFVGEDWNSLPNKPAVIASGTTQAEARTAIGAGTGNSNLALGTTAGTAREGNWTPSMSDVGGLNAAIAALTNRAANEVVTGNWTFPGEKYQSGDASELNFTAPFSGTTIPNGYLKLVTPIKASNNQMFSIDIVGYDYSAGKSIDFTVVGYAYSGTSTIINIGFSNRSSFSRDVRLVLEARGGGERVMVLALGAETAAGVSNQAWYFQKLSVKVRLWYGLYAAATVSDFSWVAGETTLSAGYFSSTNLNKLTMDGQLGTIVAGGAITASNLSGVNTGDQTNIAGNAATATKLATPRAINGVNFDGTANITVADATKEPAFATGTTAQYWRGDKTWSDFFTDVRAATLTGLSTATNAVITAADTALSALGKLQKQVSDNLTTLTSHTDNTSNPHGVTKAQVGLGNVDNTTDADKPISTATQTALDAKAPLLQPTLTGLREVRVAMAADAIDLATGNLFTKTISGATSLTVSNVPASGTLASFILDLTNGGSATITWWSGVKWAGGTAPTLTAAGRDVLGFYTHDGGTAWTGLLLGKDVK